MPTFAERFQKVATWCAANNFSAGFPTCHEITSQTPALYGACLIRTGATWTDVLRTTLGNPGSDRTRLTAAHDYAKTQNFEHGFPTFHQSGQGSNIVYGTYLIPSTMVQWQDVPVTEILGANIDPTTRPMEDWFRGTWDWATRTGRPAAMPNGHYARYNGNWVVGVFSFNPGTTEFRDLTGDELGYPREYKVGGSGW